MCNVLHPRRPQCTRMYSLKNGELSSFDQLCKSGYRDSKGNCTDWVFPELLHPGADCSTDDDCVTVPAGHGKCSCTTNPSANRAVCTIANPYPPDPQLQSALVDLLECAGDANCHIEDQTLLGK